MSQINVPHCYVLIPIFYEDDGNKISRIGFIISADLLRVLI